MLAAGFLAQPDDTGMVPLFHGTDLPVAMTADTAQHLARLLERYNWTKAEPSLYDSRWRRFWRSIQPVERRIICLYVEHSTGGHFRHTTVEFGHLPQVPHVTGALHRHRRASEAVLRELAQLEQIFLRAPGDADDPEATSITTGLPDQRTCQDRPGQVRLGQDRYREGVLARWNRACAVTGCTLAPALVASHAKPWAASTDAERLDPDNGLPLVGTLDRLFDAGLIGFDPVTGAMLIASTVSAHDRALLQLPAPLRRRPSRQQAIFLRYHLNHVFQRKQRGHQDDGPDAPGQP